MSKHYRLSLGWGALLALTLLPIDPFMSVYQLYTAMQTQWSITHQLLSSLSVILLMIVITLIQANNGQLFYRQGCHYTLSTIVNCVAKTVLGYTLVYSIIFILSAGYQLVMNQLIVNLIFMLGLLFKALIPTAALTFAMFLHLKTLPINDHSR